MHLPPRQSLSRCPGVLRYCVLGLLLVVGTACRAEAPSGGNPSALSIDQIERQVAYPDVSRLGIHPSIGKEYPRAIGEDEGDSDTDYLSAFVTGETTLLTKNRIVSTTAYYLPVQNRYRLASSRAPPKA